MENKFVNLTSHPITEITTGNTYERSGIVARVKTKSEKIDTHMDSPIYVTTFGEVEGLPEPVEGTYYIVSALILNAIPKDRTDVVAPGNVQRDQKGKIIGCMGFKRP